MPYTPLLQATPGPWETNTWNTWNVFLTFCVLKKKNPSGKCPGIFIVGMNYGSDDFWAIESSRETNFRKWPLEEVTSTSLEVCEQRLVFSFGTRMGPHDLHSLLVVKFPYVKFLLSPGTHFYLEFSLLSSPGLPEVSDSKLKTRWSVSVTTPAEISREKASIHNLCNPWICERSQHI